ncbi:MAG: isoleucine--tRNA ligase [Caldisericaceae bacterium]
MFGKLEDVGKIPSEEERLIDFWKKNDIFRKSLTNRNGRTHFVFFEGPPTANGKPGVHHGLSRIYKDTVLRYKSLSGYYVPRRGGWDTQGLPVEIEVEKMLDIHTKREIEAYGVEKFNKLCRESVMKYTEDWENMTDRIGFWLDMENAYKTYENKYLESVWWLLKQIYDKGLLYEGHKVVPYCPRCGTTLSSHEVSLGYKKVKDPSVYVFFPVKDDRFPDTSLLVWTTTPWTLPSNLAAAINPEFTYLLVEYEGRRLILAENRARALFGEDFIVIDKLNPKDIEGLEYEPPFDFGTLTPEEKEQSFRIVFGDFVTADDGTGIVHIAPAFGEDDLRVGKTYNLPMLQLVDLEGNLTAGKWKGMFVKKADPLIIEDLKERGLLFKKELYEHDYPFCWRCGTPLLYYAKGSWFISMSKVREALLKNNEQINWFPENIKNGRFGNWLENINDWALSRERYWGTPLNIWKCQKCGHTESIGSIKELREKAIEDVPEDIELHKPYVDKIHIRCPECGEPMERVPEVIDVWFDSGSMPFAQWHYPFENTKEFEENFPADFITEAIDQTRGWFYSLLAISTLVKGTSPYKTVMCLELILDEKGQKMSKSKGNVIDPWTILNAQGADAFRWAIYTASPPWSPRRFGSTVVQDSLKEFIIPLRNVYSFFALYANIDKFDPKASPKIPYEKRNILDRWVLAKLEQINKEVIDRFDKFEITPITKDIEHFVEELSNWYVRRSRRRFWKSENDEDKLGAYQTLYEVLSKLSLILAPFTPFLAETLYQKLVGEVSPDAKESVHLTDYPVPRLELIDEKLIDDTELVIGVTSVGRSLRKESKIKVRQPLSKIILSVKNKEEEEIIKAQESVILEELNIKNIEFTDNVESFVEISLKPNLPLLGAKYGNKLPSIVNKLSESEIKKELLSSGRVNIDNDISVSLNEVIIEVLGKDNFIGAFDNGRFIVIDKTLNDDLLAEGIAREIVHAVQNMRKEAKLEISDRIILSISPLNAAVEKYRDYIMVETLSSAISSFDDPISEQEVRIDERNVFALKIKKA